MTWRAFYQTKQRTKNRARNRCEYCGKRGPTHSHHLWQRRPDHEYLQRDINISQVCGECHQQETYHMQVYLGLKKLYDLPGGPAAIERWAQDAPFKLPIDLPPHYWDALDYYQQGKKPDDI